MNTSQALVALTLISALFAASCSTTSSYVYPKAVQQRYTITTGDVSRPYQSLGYVQLTKKGFDVLGAIGVVSADLEAIFGDELIPVLENAGADGIINLRFNERQWTPMERVALVLVLVGIFWVPTRVELSGELIRYTSQPAAPAPPQVPSQAPGY